MGFDYVSARLKAWRSAFVPDSALEQMGDVRSAILRLEDSMFQPEMAKLRTGERGAVSPTSIARCVEEGRLRLLGRTAALAQQWIPGIVPLVFSRYELEQVKEALRHIRTPARERRIRFLLLTPHSAWTARWRTFGSLAQFRAALVQEGHPLAAAVRPDAPPAEVEELLEKHYFSDVLPRYEAVAGETWEYFMDQHDIVNLHVCRLSAGHEVEGHFIPGPGRLAKKEIAAMSIMSETEMVRTAGARLRLSLKYRPGIAGSAQALRQAYLRKWRLRAILEPVGPWDLLVFLEELEAMAANLKLAVLAGDQQADAAPYFLERKVA